MAGSYRSEKKRRRGNYDLFGLFPFYLPGLGQSWLLVALFFVLQLALGALFALPMSFGVYGMDSYFLLTYVSTFAVLLVVCSNIGRSRAFTAEYGVAVSSRHFGKVHPLLMALAAMVGMLGTVLALDPITTLVQRFAPDASALENSMDLLMGGNTWLMFLNVAICAPFFEELLVRGIILRGLLSHIRPGWAIFWSALIFAVMHANLVQGFAALAMGMLLGYTYYKTGCLWLTMLMHFANNATSFLLMKLYPAEEEMTELVPVAAYVILVLVGIGIAVGYVYLLRKIPLEKKEGNLDTLTMEDLI